ncbi:2993_t:CDS:1, partial [Dentiscutata heterogama]
PLPGEAESLWRDTKVLGEVTNTLSKRRRRDDYTGIAGVSSKRVEELE